MMFFNSPARQRQTLPLNLSHVPLPDHVTDCERWECADGEWTRLFTVREWQVGGVLVTVSGEQDQLGNASFWLYVGGEGQFAGPDWHALMAVMVQAGELLQSLR
jgi:hypothetical protein